MNETRYDWLADRWVIFAPNRAERPDEFRTLHQRVTTSKVACPFCSGSEHETPEPTLILPESDVDMTRLARPSSNAPAYREPWLVRVVPNKFPAITRCDSPVGGPSDAGAPHTMFRSYLPPHTVGGSAQSESLSSGSMTEAGSSLQLATKSKVETKAQCEAQRPLNLFSKRSPTGAHEVIIEAPTHIDTITALPVPHIAMIFEAYRRRLCHWRAQRDLQYAVVFKNYGADAGASLFHSHSQLISCDFVPGDVVRVNQRLVDYHNEHQTCYVCDVIRKEEEMNERILVSSEHFVALCPFASRFPYSFSILPRRHRARFEECDQAEMQDLAEVVKKTLAALERAQPQAAYNYVLQTSPFRGGHESAHHWRLKVIPRISKVAGFEWGSDCFINPITPEAASDVIRSHMHP